MKQLRKRNNYTLSIEAQEIIDKVKNKSKFVSEAIVSKGCEHIWKPYPIDGFQHNYEMKCTKCGESPKQLKIIGTIPGNKKIIA